MKPAQSPPSEPDLLTRVYPAVEVLWLARKSLPSRSCQIHGRRLRRRRRHPLATATRELREWRVCIAGRNLTRAEWRQYLLGVRRERVRGR